MTDQTLDDEWNAADEVIRKILPEGIKLVRTLRGHTDFIGRIAWSPDGRILAAPSNDGTIRLWDTENGELVNILKGAATSKKSSESMVINVAFDATGQTLASAINQDLKLWDVSSGKLLHDLRKNAIDKDQILSLAFDSKWHLLACGSDNGLIKLWDKSSGRLIKVYDTKTDAIVSLVIDSINHILILGSNLLINLNHLANGKILSNLVGHQDWVVTLAFDPQSGTILSGSFDKTLKMWSLDNGQLLRSLEGHTGKVRCVAYMSDGQLIASGGDDGIRLWNPNTGACLAVIPTLVDGRFSGLPGIAFHPNLPFLATVGSDPGTPHSACDRIIHLYELDLASLLAQSVTATITYTSAKVVLVGESNVGKSYLAHRIATGAQPEEGTIKSTHGMRFWPLKPEQLGSTSYVPVGQRRDVVLWDMGGQEEYRLIHQLFLHDTAVALVLFDPTRGVAAFKEVETWNKYLEKQLSGRAAVKLLVGAKVDHPTDTIDHLGLERLRTECGFTGYYETSALTGRGVSSLCEAVANAIDWDRLGLTSRPELFQRIRDEIEDRRKQGEVVLHVTDLHQALGNHTVEEEARAVESVTEQLATQGLIARSRVSSGEPVLVLQVQEVERYAGSLIVAARNNPRGVPALELRAIAQAEFLLPGIDKKERLLRNQERPVLECTVQLMLEHGICFQHEGLLIFPSLFAPAVEASEKTLPHAASLYYDFAGAIDNIYASLIAWLVLARDFGRVRLWADRAEFEVKDGTICGLRKVARPGGFAHMDVYFHADTQELRRKEFISFVEDHLNRNGIEIREHVAIKCTCGHMFDEETLRQRIARSENNVICPVCETRHTLTEGAVEARERDPLITKHTWALRTKIEERRLRITEKAVQVIVRTPEIKRITKPIRILHLSDLHFNNETPVKARLQWLLDDIKQRNGLGFTELDYLIISGDFTDKGCMEGFEKALEFVSGLTHDFGLSAERCILIPGNHDTYDFREAYEWRESASGLKDGDWVKQGDIVLLRNPEKYPLRFKLFSDNFYHKFLQRPYPLDYTDQGIAIPFWETGVQFLALNSCWQIDQFNRKRSGLHPMAVAHAISEAQKQEHDARLSGQLEEKQPLLRLAVWHHSVNGPEQMKDLSFLGNLQKNDVRIALHGDVHEMRRELIGDWRDNKLLIIGSGSFGARAKDRPESTPCLYNVLEIKRDLNSVRVHTRCQLRPDGAWDGWYEWPDPKGKGHLPYYDIKW